jgi:hypothetical protein
MHNYAVPITTSTCIGGDDFKSGKTRIKNFFFLSLPQISHAIFNNNHDECRSSGVA